MDHNKLPYWPYQSNKSDERLPNNTHLPQYYSPLLHNMTPATSLSETRVPQHQFYGHSHSMNMNTPYYYNYLYMQPWMNNYTMSSMNFPTVSNYGLPGAFLPAISDYQYGQQSRFVEVPNDDIDKLPDREKVITPNTERSKQNHDSTSEILSESPPEIVNDSSRMLPVQSNGAATTLDAATDKTASVYDSHITQSLSSLEKIRLENKSVPLSISHPDEGNFSNRQHRSVQTTSNDNTEAVLADHCFRTIKMVDRLVDDIQNIYQTDLDAQCRSMALNCEKIRQSLYYMHALATLKDDGSEEKGLVNTEYAFLDAVDEISRTKTSTLNANAKFHSFGRGKKILLQLDENRRDRQPYFNSPIGRKDQV